MAIPTSILKFKSPGVKQILEIADNPPQAIVPTGARILIANSKKGRVNTLVPISDFSQYKSNFDGISDADERRGNWSARSAEYMLGTSPIYVLNLRSFEDSLDTAGVQELSSTTTANNNVAKIKPFKKLFNTQQFWKVDPIQLIDSQNTDNLLVFGNIGVDSLSVFVRKSKVQQYNQTMEVWYKNLGRQMPDYVNPTDKVKDWLIDVVIFKNAFNASSASNVNYGYCFDVNGNVKNKVVNSSSNTVDGLDQLTSIAESGHIVTFTGSLINGFKNESNGNFDIISIVNSYVDVVGLLATRNENLFDSAAIWLPGETSSSDGLKKPVPVDMKGHSACHINEVGNFSESLITDSKQVEFLSYSYEQSFFDATDLVSENGMTNSLAPEVDNKSTFIKMKAYLKGEVNSTGGISFTGEKNKLFVVGSLLKPNVGESFVGYDGNLSTVTKVTALGEKSIMYGVQTKDLAILPFNDDVEFSDSKDWEDADGEDNTYKFANSGSEFPRSANGDYYVYPATHVLAGLPLAFVATGIVHNPNKTGAATYTLDVKANMTTAQFQAALVALPAYTPTATLQVIDVTSVSKNKLVKANKFNTLKEKFSMNEYIYEIEADKNLAINSGIGESNTVDLSTSLVVSESTKLTDDSGKTYNTYNNNFVVFKVNTPDSVSTILKPITLKAYSPRERQFLNGSADRQNEILNVLKETSISNGLQNQDLNDWMYIVDGFKTFIEPNVKYQLKDVAKERITGRAIYNLPSIYDFSQSTNPYFKQTSNSDFEVKFIPQGGNLELPHSNTFSLPNVDGHFAYGFGPGLTLTDGKIMPPAAVVSNLFARKHLVGQPYIILAGNKNGLIRAQGVTGVEYTFIEKNDGQGDRDLLDPFGFNLIVNKRNSGGLQLYSNKTSYNTVDSPVSSIHTSEIIMFLQLRIKSLLENYVFQYNTAQNRLIIKTQADGICQEPQQAGAIDRFLNVMDDSNNTAEIIANRIGILDTTIVANNGMEILVHRTKIDTLTNTASFEIV